MLLCPHCLFTSSGVRSWNPISFVSLLGVLTQHLVTGCIGEAVFRSSTCFQHKLYYLMSCGPILSMYNLSELPWHYQNHPLPLNNSHCVLFSPLPPWFSIFSKLPLLACTHTDRSPRFGTKAAKHLFYRTYSEHTKFHKSFPRMHIDCNNWRFKAISLEKQTKKTFWCMTTFFVSVSTP